MVNHDGSGVISSSSSSSCYSRFWSSALRAKRLATPAEKAARRNSSQGLSSRLGVFDLILIGIGASVGGGIFVLTGTAARDAGPGLGGKSKISGPYAIIFSIVTVYAALYK